MKHHTPRPKRTKAYRPRHIQVPIMPELQRIMMFDGHGALAALRLAPNRAALDQLVGIFNAISVAVADSGRQSVILDSGMRALQDVVDRYARTGVVGVGCYELPPIENALLECEQLIKTLDIVSLHTARLKAEALQKLSLTATSPLEPA